MRLAQELIARCRQSPDLIEQFKRATELVDEVQEAERALLVFRGDIVRRLRETGMKWHVMAERVGLTRSRLYQISRKLAEHPPQEQHDQDDDQ